MQHPDRFDINGEELWKRSMPRELDFLEIPIDGTDFVAFAAPDLKQEQLPRLRQQSLIVLQGPKGLDKNLFAKQLGRYLLNRHSSAAASCLQ